VTTTTAAANAAGHSVPRRIEALIDVLGLRDAITARDTNTGDGHALDVARKRSVEAILRRRTIELTTHALPAAAAKALAFRAVLDPTCPGEPLPWLRHAATSRAARL